MPLSRIRWRRPEEVWALKRWVARPIPVVPPAVCRQPSPSESPCGQFHRKPGTSWEANDDMAVRLRITAIETRNGRF